ncbi:ATP-binding cassette domain-containing protein [Conexibacter stalactiti]|uniref:ATP-binding cassette domain-containing protein n=1 Tax=Conexibacter stalactiti TaxID=1940611 RepID=A0ABU4HLC0_9ACTN|nr:ATP-binding cassette domain-containing protein [Conexibacter stalactiti]MDW5594108.1 ATP-binding cassette domain-containing protein [Conexibacter stalactiti]MEC5034750.1 ATP-binding cassette domain-containing protein [Conexibacter stalactiti]
MSSTPLLRLHGVTKRFGRTEVLRGIDCSIAAGEAVGLIGDNGAGKSTLVKVLSGVYAPSGGSIELAGEEVRFSSPLEARSAGIEMIYQDLALCDDLDAAANVFLGREPRRRIGGARWLDRGRMRSEAAARFEQLGAEIPLDQPVGSMSGGQRQLVAVARALEFSPRLLLMDEPTAALSNAKIHMLLQVVRKLEQQDVAVLLISHRFTDLIEVCSRILALRDGRIAASIAPRGRDVAGLMAEMQVALTGETLAAVA